MSNIFSLLNKRSNIASSTAGFTIIELLVATAVFSVVLLVITVGVLSLTHDYYRGITGTKTQTVARSITADIAQGIQFSSNGFTPIASNADGTMGFCLGGNSYSYLIGIEVTDGTNNDALHQNNHGLVKYTDCTTTAHGIKHLVSLPSGARELLSNQMRLSRLTMSTDAYGDTTVEVKVATGDDDLLSNPTTGTANCMSGSGSQYCSVSDLSTTVQKRL